MIPKKERLRITVAAFYRSDADAIQAMKGTNISTTAFEPINNFHRMFKMQMLQTLENGNTVIWFGLTQTRAFSQHVLGIISMQQNLIVMKLTDNKCNGLKY